MAITDNLLAYYKLDGNSNDSLATFNGTDTSITYSGANGKINSGAGFNGTSSNINLGTLLAGLTAFTISVWIKPNSYSGFPFVVAYGGTIDPWTGFLLMNTGLVHWGINASSNHETDGTITISTGVWSHIVVTYDGATMKCYVNNVLDTNTVSIASQTVAGVSTPVTFAGQKGNHAIEFFDGAMDELAVWSRAITAGEVSTVNNGGNGNQWPFILPPLAKNLIMARQAVNRASTY